MKKSMFLHANKIVFLLFVSSMFLLASCSNNSNNESNDNLFRFKGDSITQIAQQTLLLNVAGAIQEGGLAYAIDFCNVNALLISDSLSKAFSTTISRVTDKARNPINTFNDMDQKVFDAYIDKQNFTKDTLVKQGETTLYYKPIMIGMPTCLKCHGVIGEDLDSVFYQKVISKYPEDKAIAYKMYDLRGMWKVEF